MSDFLKNAIHHFFNNSSTLIATEVGFKAFDGAQGGASGYMEDVRIQKVLYMSLQLNMFSVVLLS